MKDIPDEQMAREWLEKMGMDLMRVPVSTLAAFCGFVREYDAYKQATKPTPEKTGVGAYCQPGDRREPRWVVMYDDADRTTSVFEDEQDARDAFANSEGAGWNCWLFSPTPRHPPRVTQEMLDAQLLAIEGIQGSLEGIIERKVARKTAELQESLRELARVIVNGPQCRVDAIVAALEKTR